MGLYRSFCVLMNSNGSLWVFINSCASLLFLMRPYGSLWVLQFSSVNLFGEHRHKIMIPNAHNILIAAGFMRSPNNDL